MIMIVALPPPLYLKQELYSKLQLYIQYVYYLNVGHLVQKTLLTALFNVHNGCNSEV